MAIRTLIDAALDAALGRATGGRIGERPPVVAVLRLAGVITPNPMPLRGGTLNLAGLAAPIERAFTMRGVEAVALAVNSPGGSPVQAALVCRRIRALAEEKNLPVFAFAEDVAASGGYWLACAADEIYADPSSIVGSIGVVSAGFGFAELLDKIGVERRAHAQGDRKLLLDPFAPEKPEDVKRLEAIQKDIHQSFKDLVSERRGDRLAGRKSRTIFSGEAWTGRRALELGLIDGLGDLRSVMRARYGDKVKLRLVGARRPWLRRRLGFGGRGGGEPGGDWAWSLMSAIEARGLWARYGL